MESMSIFLGIEMSVCSPLPTRIDDKRTTLLSYLVRLKRNDADKDLFRKLIRLSRETAVDSNGRPLKEKDLSAKLSPNNDVWEGGDRFVDCVEAIVQFLRGPNVSVAPRIMDSRYGQCYIWLTSTYPFI